MLAWLTLRPAGPILAAPGLTFDGLDIGQLAGESVTVKFGLSFVFNFVHVEFTPFTD